MVGTFSLTTIHGDDFDHAADEDRDQGQHGEQQRLGFQPAMAPADGLAVRACRASSGAACASVSGTNCPLLAVRTDCKPSAQTPMI